MDYKEILTQRRSIRAFQDKPVPDDVLNTLLQQALESPSSSNTQPYKIAVAKGEVAKQISEELSHHFWQINGIQDKSKPAKLFSMLTNKSMPNGDFKPKLAGYPKELEARRAALGASMFEALGIARDDQDARSQNTANNFKFFGAPVAIFIFVHSGVKHTSFVDAGIFMQSLMIGATNLGLGTCAQGSLGLWRSPLDKHFDIPKDYKLLNGLSLGYPTEDKINSYRPEKLSLEQLLIPEMA